MVWYRSSSSSPSGNPVFHPYKHKVDDQTFHDWLKNYKAANPLYQDFCTQALSGGPGNSQHEQDVTLFHNIFKPFVVSGRKGFYVESGANQWKEFSNTFFFDVCLGWDGLCIEPQSTYIAGLKEHRTCQVLQKCISDKQTTANMNGTGGMAKIATMPGSSGSIECLPLAEMLKNTKGGSRNHIDFWSLDVEGFEMEVLSSINFNAVTVSALLIEDFWISQRNMDRLLTNADTGLVKYLQFPVDSLFIHHEVVPAVTKTKWFPPSWKKNWDWANWFRNDMRKEGKLSNEY